MKSWRFWGFILPLSFILTVSFQNCSPNSSENSSIPESCSGENCVENTDGTQDVAGTRACSFNGNSILHGEAVDAYLASAGERCEPQRRTCDDGNLSGNYQFPSCVPDPAAKKACLFDGRAIAHGSSVQAFMQSTVVSGQSCTAQTRTCNDGTLSGNYTFSKCATDQPASCVFDGRTLAHGQSVRAFLHSASPANQTLCSISQNRVCKNGTLEGSYSFSSCTVNQAQACTFNGTTVPHGGQVVSFQHSSSPHGQTLCANKQTRLCQDGSLSGSYGFSSCSVDKPRACTFDGKTVAHGASVSAFLHSSAAFGSSDCKTREQRTCDNGTLKGSYKFSSCQVGAAKACLFNDKTIPHAGTVTGYRESTGVRGQAGACSPITRTCNNGVLSNSGATFASCTLNQPKACLFKDKTVPHGSSIEAYAKKTNDGTGKCTPQTRTCNNGVLSGTATFESCVHSCTYGKFTFNENQVIFYRMNHPRGLCGDSDENCRIFQASATYVHYRDGKSFGGCDLAGLRCSPAGNGRIDVMKYSVDNKADLYCQNPMMSTPVNPSNLTSTWGDPLTPQGSSMMLQGNVDRSNSKLLWHKPYRLKGPLPK